MNQCKLSIIIGKLLFCNWICGRGFPVSSKFNLKSLKHPPEFILNHTEFTIYHILYSRWKWYQCIGDVSQNSLNCHSCHFVLLWRPTALPKFESCKWILLCITQLRMFKTSFSLINSCKEQGLMLPVKEMVECNNGEVIAALSR